MRLVVLIAAAALMMPAPLMPSAHASGLTAPQTDLSAARKKKKPAKSAPKEEYLKAAPGTGPSGPKK